MTIQKRKQKGGRNILGPIGPVYRSADVAEIQNVIKRAIRRAQNEAMRHVRLQLIRETDVH